MKILFVLGSVVISGGNYVVLQHAAFAREKGHDVTLAVLGRYTPADLGWHPSLASLRLVQFDEISLMRGERFDIAIATYWRTALELSRFKARQYAYFVQSIESRFYDESQSRMRRLVDSTYAFGLPGITEAGWIQRHLRERYRSEYLLARNGIRKDIYTLDGPRHAPRTAGGLRVLVEGPFSAPMKNTARTLRVVARSRANETWLLTSSDVSWHPQAKRIFSRVPIGQVADVYRSCDVLVKLSFVEGMFGPPLEMFHCGGTAVVYDVSGHDEYIVHDGNALVARMHDEAAVIAHLDRLHDEPGLLARLRDGARATAAAWPDWEEASKVFLSHLEAICASEPILFDELKARTAAVFEEFENELRPPTHHSAVATSATSASNRLRRVSNAVRRYKRALGFIAEGYR